MTLYRFCIDESGNHQYPTANWSSRAWKKIENRYLSLTGVIIENQHYQEVILPRMRDIKSLIAPDSGNLPVLHLSEIMHYKGFYNKLKKQPELEKQLYEQLLNLLHISKFTVCTAVMDKITRFRRNGQAAGHPYNLTFIALLESCVHFLHANGTRGDVMPEARGGKYDRELEAEYRKFYQYGTKTMSAKHIQTVLTSRKLKMRKKAGWMGLELADLLALSSKLDVLHSFGQLDKIHNDFYRRIANAIQDKYYSSNSKIKGFGKKFI